MAANEDSDEDHAFSDDGEENSSEADTSGNGEFVSSAEGAGVESTESIEIERATASGEGGNAAEKSDTKQGS